MVSDLSNSIQEQVQTAYAEKKPIQIIGGNSKGFYGCKINAEALYIEQHCGVLSYEPTELVIRARAGTRLKEIEDLLTEKGQMLAFEPPHFGSSATIGGMLAAGLSGPRRMYSGAVRDHVLGVTCINGKGEVLQFGGQVMKNVAGYDVSRLMAGSLGGLAIILDVSLKVIPKPEYEISLVLESEKQDALNKMRQYYLQGLSMSASTYCENKLYIRLSGSKSSIEQQVLKIADSKECDKNIWYSIKEQQLDFFQSSRPLFRFSVPAHTSINDLDADIIEWGGSVRWLYSDEDFNTLEKKALAVNGSVSRFHQASEGQDYFQALTNGLEQLHKNLKQAFDPGHILNPGRIYHWL